MRKIIEKYRKWKEGKEEDYLYDETYSFIGNLTRAECMEMMEYLDKSYDKQLLLSKSNNSKDCIVFKK